MSEAATGVRGARARRRGVDLFRVRGIRVRLDFSWFLIFLLIFFTLSAGYFPGVSPELGPLAHWTAGLIATLLFFGSILLHELAHAFVALRAGIAVPEITLFLFGGVSRMAEEPRTPQVELRVALAGPLMSFLLALVFGGLYLATRPAPPIVPLVFGYLAWINLALGVFNLLPGYPLDGGRVLRALAWWRTGSLRRATRLAAGVGSVFAVALMLLGAMQILFGGLIGGLWLILIGIFLRSLARRGYEDVVLRGVLSDVDVGDVMVPREELVVVPPGLTLRALVDDWFLGRGIRGFPVVEDGRTLGIVSAQEVRAVPRERWPEVTVREVMQPLDERSTVPPDLPLIDALGRIQGSSRRLAVLRDGALVGLLSAGSVARFVELKSLAHSA